MKILQVYKDVHPFVRGGIERYVHDLSAFLASGRHEVTVMVAGVKGSSHEVSGFEVLEYPCLARILSNPVSPGLGKMMASFGADVIHLHVPLPSAVISKLASGDDTPYVVTYHSDIVRQWFLMPLYGPFLRRFLGKAEKVLATSPVYRDTSKYLSGLKNVEVLPIGVDLERFSPGNNPSRDYFLFVGRFRGYKGIDVLLRAWRRLPARKLVMVGGGSMTDEIRRFAVAENLEIRIFENIDDEELVNLYRNARALILPSVKRSEAYGMVQLEAMACGTPVVSTGLPTGVPWVNRDGASGLIVPPGDVDALVDAVIRMEDDEIHGELSRGALSRARNSFDSGVLFRKVEEILERVAMHG